MELFTNRGMGDDKDIVVVRGKILDNHILSGGILTDDGIWAFAKKLLNKPSEWMARIEGEPKHFSGLVYGDEINKEEHVIDDFEPPQDWTFYEGVDPHDGKATHWGFFAVSPDKYVLPESKRKVNKVYMLDYLCVQGKPISGIIKDVNIKRATYGYDRPAWVVLDAKYGRRTHTSMETRTCWQTELQRTDKGVAYILSDSSPGAVELGHKIVKEYLSPKYSPLRGADVPTFSFMAKCDGGAESPVQGFFSYAYDEDQKVKTEYKDWPDVVRYFLVKFPLFRGRSDDYRERYKMESHSEWAV